MTEIGWELRSQIDDLRAIIQLLKDNIVVEDQETGIKEVSAKNVQLLQGTQTNLRKILAADVRKSISYDPTIAYTRHAASTDKI